jgi:hypothetical protein
MTQDDRAYYRRRLQEELAKSQTEDRPDLRHLHARWASLYQARLEGKHISLSDPADASLRIVS